MKFVLEIDPPADLSGPRDMLRWVIDEVRRNPDLTWDIHRKDDVMIHSGVRLAPLPTDPAALLGELGARGWSVRGGRPAWYVRVYPPDTPGDPRREVGIIVPTHPEAVDFWELMTLAHRQIRGF